MGNIDNMMNWFKVKIAEKTCYSQDTRYGNPCYDCSSSVYYALKQGEFISSNSKIGNTGSLQTLLPQIAIEIPRAQCKYGDIFLSMNGTYGNHTGVFKNYSTIWHTTSAGRVQGTVESPAEGWMGDGKKSYWRLKNIEEELDIMDRGQIEFIAFSDTTNKDVMRRVEDYFKVSKIPYIVIHKGKSFKFDGVKRLFVVDNDIRGYSKLPNQWIRIKNMEEANLFYAGQANWVQLTYNRMPD